MTPTHSTVGSSPIFLITDAGPDNDQSTFSDGRRLPVWWNSDVNAFEAPGKVIADRSEQIPDHPPGHHGEARIHWLALQGTDVSQMKRVVWDQYEYRDASNVLIRDTGWVSIDPIDGKRKIWNSGTWDERKTLTKIYNPSTQQYEII